MDEQVQNPEDVDWEQRLCPTEWCEEQVLYVRRCSKHKEVWRVTASLDQDAYLVAAFGPVCPFCGGNLLTAANVMEGVDILGEEVKR